MKKDDTSGILTVDEMWCFLAIDEEDKIEGLVAMGSLPLIAADKDRVASIWPMAKKIAKESGKKVKLVRFSVREDISEVV